MESLSLILVTDNTSITNGWGRMGYMIYNLMSTKCKRVFLFQPSREDNALHEHFPIYSTSNKYNVFLSFINAYRMYLYLKRKKVLDENFLIQTISEKNILDAYLLSLFIRSPLVISLVGTYSLRLVRDPILGWIYRYIFNRSYLWSISNFTANKVRRYLRRHKFIPIIYLGNNVRDRSMYKDELRRRFLRKQGIVVDSSELLFLTVGPIKHRKGILLSVMAFIFLCKLLHKKMKYIILGPVSEEKYYENIKRIILRFGFEDRIYFITRSVSQQDLEKFYASADFYIMLSSISDRYFEGFGMVFVESMSNGCIPIGCKFSTLEEIAGDVGIYIDCNNVLASTLEMAPLLEYVIQNYEFYSNRCKILSNNFRWKLTCDRLFKYYSLIINNSR